MKSYKKYIFILILAILGYFVFSKIRCIGKNHVSKSVISEQEHWTRGEIKLQERVILKEDSLQKVAKKAIEAYKYLLRHPAKYYVHDTVRIDSLIYLAQKQDTVIQRDSVLIKELYVQVSNLNSLDSLNQAKNSRLKFERDSIASAPKGNLKWFIRGAGIGFATGYLTGFSTRK